MIPELLAAADWGSILLGAGGAAGIAGAFLAIFKGPAERDSVIVKSAEGVVVMQESALRQARTDISDAKADAAAARAEAETYRDRLDHVEEVASECKRQVQEALEALADCQDEREAAQAAATGARLAVRDLQEENQRLKMGGDSGKGQPQ